MLIFPLPPELSSNRYLDLLYAPLAARPDLQIRRLRPARRLPVELWRARQPAVLHLHWFDELLQRRSRLATALRSISFLLLLRLLQQRGVRLVWTAHNLEPHELLHRGWAARVYRALVRLADAVIVHSQAAERLLCERYGAPRLLRCIPHGHYIGVYGPEVEQQQARRRLGLPLDEPLLLAPGALRPYKDYERLLEAFAGLQPSTRSRLLIAGAPRDQAYGQALARRAAAIPGAQLRAGFIADQDLPLYLGAADLVVLPYERILTSGMLLCALSYSRPVLAPDLPPIAELVREGQQGFLYPAGSLAGLQAALQRALQYADLTQLRGPARAAVEPLDWTSVATRTAELYAEVLRAGSPASPA